MLLIGEDQDRALSRRWCIRRLRSLYFRIDRPGDAAARSGRDHLRRRCAIADHEQREIQAGVRRCLRFEEPSSWRNLWRRGTVDKLQPLIRARGPGIRQMPRFDTARNRYEPGCPRAFVSRGRLKRLYYPRIE